MNTPARVFTFTRTSTKFVANDNSPTPEAFHRGEPVTNEVGLTIRLLESERANVDVQEDGSIGMNSIRCRIESSGIDVGISPVSGIYNGPASILYM